MSSRPDVSLRQHRSAEHRYPPSARLELLGGFELRSGRESVRPPLHVQRLLAFLALQNRSLHRTYVAGRLWLDMSQEHANGCLRSTLWRMNRLPCELVVASATHVGLADELSVDVDELEAISRRVLRGGGEPVVDAELRCLIEAGDLLPDSYDDWVIQERERLRQLRLMTLETLADRLIDSQRYGEATLAALTAAAADPLRESAYRILIRCHLETGNVGEALRQFGVFRAGLSRQLGLEPTAAIFALIDGLVGERIPESPSESAGSRLP